MRSAPSNFAISPAVIHIASRPRRSVANSRRIVLSSRCRARRSTFPLRYCSSAVSTFANVFSRSDAQCESGRSGAGRGRVWRRTHQYHAAIAASSASPTIHTQAEYGGAGSWIAAAIASPAAGSSTGDTLLPPQGRDELIDEVVHARRPHRFDPAPAQHLAHFVPALLGERLRLPF